MMASKASGVSGFAFQGTNAHVILHSRPAKQRHLLEGLALSLQESCHPAQKPSGRISSLKPKVLLSEQAECPSYACHAAGGQTTPVWHKWQIWFLPVPHYFLLDFAKLDSTLAFELDLSTPALAYIWEHQVRALTGRRTQLVICLLICRQRGTP